MQTINNSKPESNKPLWASGIFIGLGANLSDPVEQLRLALEAIKLIPSTELIQCSSFYQTEPMGPKDQDDYINAVAEVRSGLSPLELLDNIQTIENKQGRVRKKERWGPRTLDLDILLFGDTLLNSPRLTIPHYGIKHRSFVLIPLAEIAPNIQLPIHGDINELIDSIGWQGIQKL